MLVHSRNNIIHVMKIMYFQFIPLKDSVLNLCVIYSIGSPLLLCEYNNMHLVWYKCRTYYTQHKYQVLIFLKSQAHISIIPPNFLNKMDNGLACILMLPIDKLWNRDWEIGRSYFKQEVVGLLPYRPCMYTRGALNRKPL